MATLNLQVAADNNDAWQNASGVIAGVAGDDPSIGALTSGSFWAGFRWTGASAVAGATIDPTTAIQLYVLTTTNDDLVADFYFEAADTPAVFTTTASDISNRTRTTNKQAVNALSIGANTWYSITGADLAAALQEVVNRPGFSGTIVAILDGLAGISFGCRDYFGEAITAAKLDIVYTVGGGGSKVRRVRLSARVGGVLVS